MLLRFFFTFHTFSVRSGGKSPVVGRYYGRAGEIYRNMQMLSGSR